MTLWPYNEANEVEVAIGRNVDLTFNLGGVVKRVENVGASKSSQREIGISLVIRIDACGLGLNYVFVKFYACFC